MSVQERLQQDVADFDYESERLTKLIEDLEAAITDKRRKRDDVRFKRAELAAALHVLDNIGFAVERDDATGGITVRVDPPEAKGER